MKKLLLVALLLVAIVFAAVACKEDPKPTTDDTTVTVDANGEPTGPADDGEKPTDPATPGDTSDPAESGEPGADDPADTNDPADSDEPGDDSNQPGDDSNEPGDDSNQPGDDDPPAPGDDIIDGTSAKMNLDFLRVDGANKNEPFPTTKFNVLLAVEYEGWIGFDQAITAFGYRIDNNDIVYNDAFLTNFANPEHETAVQAAGGQYARTFKINASMDGVSVGEHTLLFVAKLADGTVAKFAEHTINRLQPLVEDADFAGADYTLKVNDFIEAKKSDSAKIKVEQKVEGDVVYAHITSGNIADPWMLFNGIPGLPRYVIIRYRTNTTTDGEIFAGASGDPRGGDSFKFGYNPIDEKWQTLMLDMSEYAAIQFDANGKVNYFRYDFFTGHSTGYIDIDYIAFFSDKDVWESHRPVVVKPESIDLGASGYAAGTSLKLTGLSEFFTIYPGMGGFQVQDYKGTLVFNMYDINEMHTAMNAPYFYTTNNIDSEGNAWMFVRGYQYCNSDSLLTNADKKDYFAIGNYYETDGNGKLGSSGIYAQIEDGVLRFFVKYYDENDLARIGNAVFQVPVTGTNLTIADDGELVTIMVDGVAYATIKLEGTKVYDDIKEANCSTFNTFAAKATITLATGNSYVIENTLVADTVNSEIGVAARLGHFRFSHVTVDKYENIEVDTLVLRENVALNKPISADSEQNADNVAAYANDGDETTKWGAAPTGTANLTLDLGEVMSIDKLTVYLQKAVVPYTITYSVDGENWQLLREMTASDTARLEIAFVPTDMQYIKFTRGECTEQHNWFSIYEIYAYAAESGSSEEKELPFHSSVDRVNGFGPNGSANYSGKGGNITVGCDTIDFAEGKHSFTVNTDLTIDGWLGTTGGVAYYIWSADGGETWNNVVSGGANGEPVPGHYAGIGYQNALQNGMFNGKNILVADLKDYVGQTVDVTFAAVPANDTSARISFVTITNVTVTAPTPALDVKGTFLTGEDINFTAVGLQGYTVSIALSTNPAPIYTVTLGRNSGKEMTLNAGEALIPSLADLSAGFYVITLKDVDGTVLIEKDIRIEDPKAMSTNKDVYAPGEEIVVNATGIASDWVAIYKKGDKIGSVLEGGDQFLSYYNIGANSGKDYVLTNGLTGGEYVVVFFANNSYVIVDQKEITVQGVSLDKTDYALGAIANVTVYGNDTDILSLYSVGKDEALVQITLAAFEGKLYTESVKAGAYRLVLSSGDAVVDSVDFDIKSMTVESDVISAGDDILVTVEGAEDYGIGGNNYDIVALYVKQEGVVDYYAELGEAEAVYYLQAKPENNGIAVSLKSGTCQDKDYVNLPAGTYVLVYLCLDEVKGDGFTLIQKEIIVSSLKTEESDYIMGADIAMTFNYVAGDSVALYNVKDMDTALWSDSFDTTGYGRFPLTSYCSETVGSYILIATNVAGDVVGQWEFDVNPKTVSIEKDRLLETEDVTITVELNPGDLVYIKNNDSTMGIWEYDGTTNQVKLFDFKKDAGDESMGDLPIGNYTFMVEYEMGENADTVVKYISDLTPFTVSAKTLTTDKDKYEVGEAINVTADGLGKDWVGIALPGEDHTPYWWYLNPVEGSKNVVSGEAFDLLTAENNANGLAATYVVPAITEALIPGEYVLYLVENDQAITNSDAIIATKTITIVDNKEQTETFKSDVTSNAADTYVRDSDLMDFFAGAKEDTGGTSAVINDGRYQLKHTDEIYATVTGPYYFTTFHHADSNGHTSGQIGLFVRGYHEISFGSKALIGNYAEDDGTKLPGLPDGYNNFGGSGIYVSMNTNEKRVRINIKGYDPNGTKGVQNYIFNLKYVGDHGSEPAMSIVDNGSVVSIYVEDELVASIALAGYVQYADNNQNKGFIKYATVMNAAGETVEGGQITDTLVAATTASQIGMACRLGFISTRGLQVGPADEFSNTLKPITGMTAIATSVQNADATLAAKFAVDGDVTTRWGAHIGGSGVNNQVMDGYGALTIDLGKVYKLSRLEILFESAPAPVNVYTSVDGVNYVKVHTIGSDLTNNSLLNISVSTEAARYVRVERGTSNALNKYFSIYEVTAYATDEGKAADTNAPGMVITAEQLYNSYTSPANVHYKNSSAAFKGDYVTLTGTGNDSYVFAVTYGANSIDVSSTPWMVVKYRTTHAGKPEMYLDASGKPAGSNEYVFTEDYVADGQWHTIKVNLADIAWVKDDTNLGFLRFDFFANKNGVDTTGKVIDIQYIGFYASAEAADAYDQTVAVDLPTWNGSDKSIVTHQSYNELRVGGEGGTNRKPADNKLTVATTDKTLFYWGWVGVKGEVGTFGYQIDEKAIVIDTTAVRPAETPVVNVAAGTGADKATRMGINIDIAGLAKGEHVVKVFYFSAAGTVELNELIITIQ